MDVIERQLAGVKVSKEPKIVSYFSEDRLPEQRQLIEMMILAPPWAAMTGRCDQCGNFGAILSAVRQLAGLDLGLVVVEIIVRMRMRRCRRFGYRRCFRSRPKAIKSEELEGLF